MARDRDGDGLGANQSKQPQAAYFDLGDQPQQHHRVRSQKHIVGGATGGRLHARIPSSKGLHKHHAATSTTKLNRKHGSLSPERGSGEALAKNHHRRATSELKLTGDPPATNLKGNTSQTNLKRNRSHVEVGKRTKSATNLHRSVSNPAVHKLKSSGGSRVQFNLGDEGQDGDEDDEDEWVDASSSASPLLSRRGSVAQTANPPAAEGAPSAASPTPYSETRRSLGNGSQHNTQKDAQSGAQNGATTSQQAGNQSLPRNKSNLNQYITSRLLSRTPSHGAPPMMSTETVSVRPPSIRQQSPPSSSQGQGEYLSHSPGPTSQPRPGSSGKAELTSRFVGHNSQEPGSGTAGESFILAAHRGGLSRAALNGKDDIDIPKRRQSIGALSQGRGMDALQARQATAEDDASDDDDSAARISRSRRSGEYTMPRDMNRTQQKLNLQRASSSLEPPHPHPGMGIIPPGVAAAGAAGPLIGVPNTYDFRDPRVAKMLERTGMEYLTVRRHLNPVARSIARVMQLPGLQNSRRIPQPPGGVARHVSRLSEQFGNTTSQPVTRNSSMADLINGHSHSHSHSHSSGGRRPPTPRSSAGGGVGNGGSGGGAFSALQSASSSLKSDDGASRMHGGHQGHGNGNGQLSGSSLVDGAEDAGTVALLRMMWDKNLDLSSSQD